MNEGTKLCDFCGAQPASDRYREITGLEELRVGGGANKIVGRRVTGRVPCVECARKIKKGVALGQQTLL